jgi:hypothetical protein
MRQSALGDLKRGTTQNAIRVFEVERLGTVSIRGFTLENFRMRKGRLPAA